ncbi:putative transcription factor C2H2 family [Lupinus albus]|uniref:Putative transcription factor C2H2 family n=1 Tax=Lupinus albus TaxID=3870 RepID=A0A6A4PLM7_LUPAL|nr:putative transcription factor C2H2 family [Lupinus albus]
MEFKFRAVDEAPPPPPITTSYPTTVTYISHRSLRGMIPSPRHNSFPMPMNSASESLRRELEKEQIRREIIAGEIRRRRELEEEVRRELALERGWGMTTAETSHGFSFKERVSMMRLNPSSYLFNNNARSQPQLMPSAELKPYPETNDDNVIKLGPVKYMSPSLYRLDTIAWPQSQLPQLMAPAEEFKPSPVTNNDKAVTLGSVKFPSPCRYRIDNNNDAWPQPPLAQLMAPVGEFKPSLETNNDVVKQGSVNFPSPGQYQFANNAWTHPQLPELMAPAEFKPYEETHKDKVIKLAKPDPDRYDAKRKAVAPDVDRNDQFPSSLKKKPKEDWSCAVCQVSATSEKGLKDHLQGRKHKAKEIALRKQKIFKSTNTSFSSKKSEKSVKSNQLMDTTTSGLDAKADRQPLQSSITCGDINQTMAGEGAVESKNEEQLVRKNVKSNEPMYTTTSGLGAKANSLPIQPSFISWMDINQTVAGKGAVESKNEEQLVPKNVKFNEPMDTTTTSVLDAKEDKLPVQPSFITWKDINHTTADKCAVESKNKEELVPKNVKSESVDTTETSGLGAKADRLPHQPTFKTCGDIKKTESHKEKCEV